MSRLLLAAVLLFLALTGLLDWNGQRSTAARYRDRIEQTAPLVRTVPAANWAREALGGPPPPTPALLELHRSLVQWKLDPPELAGAELLAAGQAGAAAWVLLDRWLSIVPGSGGRATLLRLSAPDPAGPLQLEAELEGPPAAVLPWVRSLLAQPVAAGVLADPRRLDLRIEDQLLRARLIVHAWPAEALMIRSG
ncbi:MAG: hypothetical protein ISR76_10905 [Planctomycetes bacterium]|nr:hypothetical protein [Planctomycetota bacterium]MBL7009499.1 hypothetical protein [Planctomycetota bacterium]